MFKGLVGRPWALRLLAASFALAAMMLLYRKIRDIARIMLVLWGGLLLTSIWVAVEGMMHLQTRLLFDFPPGAFHLNIAFLLGLGNGTMLVMFNFLGYYNICHLGDEVREPGAGDSPGHHRIDSSRPGSGSGNLGRFHGGFTVAGDDPAGHRDL